MSTRLAIDWTRCDGHGVCAAIAPDLLGVDPWGFPVVRTHRAPDPADVARVVALCPALALREESA